MNPSNKIFDTIWDSMKGLCVAFYTGDIGKLEMFAGKIKMNLDLLIKFVKGGQ